MHAGLWSGDDLVATGPNRAKIRRPPPRGPLPGRLVLVTATTPTQSGEGKTVTAIGLADALAARGRRAAVTLRTSSLGPTLGRKGGGAGGGAACLHPLDEALLGLGGDLFAVESANNLLAAAIDEDLRAGPGSVLASDSVRWRRVIDMDDRALRSITVHPDGTPAGPGRDTGFDITAASEVMAVLSLADDLFELRDRLARVTVGRDRDDQLVSAEELGVAGAMTALLREAMWPNLFRTLAGTPAVVHGGAFANIAHGCTSVVAERLALERAEVVVTEAGFGADLGAQKRLDVVVAAGGPIPDAIVLVTTVRSLADHGRRLGPAANDAGSAATDADAVEVGSINLDRHLDVLASYGIPIVVAVNQFPDDDPAIVAAVEARAVAGGAAAATSHSAYRDGPAGAAALAEVVEGLLDQRPDFRPLVDDSLTLDAALERLASHTYGAASVDWSDRARQDLERLRADGLDHLQPCVAKTHLSFSHDPTLAGAPSGYAFPVGSLRPHTGAGFVTVMAGDILTMPGLPARPNYLDLDVDDAGAVVGLT